MTLPHIAVWFGNVSNEDADGRRSSRSYQASDVEPANVIVEDQSSRDRADLDLLHAIGAGDETAFRTLYDRIYPSLWDFARSLADSRDLADDLAQEAFMLLWKRASTWDIKTHIRGFLFTTVRNLTRNTRRHQHFVARTEESHHLEIASMAMAAVPGTPEERIRHRELIETVGRVVASLPEPRWTALLLRWKEQLPYEEIARVLGVSTVAAQRLVTRARVTVKRHIAPLIEP